MKRQAAALLIALFSLPTLSADTKAIIIDHSIDDFPPDRIISSLMEGHRSEVRFEMRVFKKVSGLRRVFGDRLIHRSDLKYVARWDAMLEQFVVVIDDTREVTFGDGGSFLDFFLALSGYVLTVDEVLDDDDYVLCRSRIQPIKLAPPLTLMTLIKSDLQMISDWRKTPAGNPVP